LEWAPQDAIGVKKQTSIKKKKTTNMNRDSDDSDKEEDENDENVPITRAQKLKASFLDDIDDDVNNSLTNDENTSIYVKNVSFQTKEDQLKALFLTEAGITIRNVFIPKNKNKAAASNTTDAKRALSLGYGFIEFGDRASVEIALSKFQGAVLDGKALELKRSQKKLGPSTSSTSEQSGAVKTTKKRSAAESDDDDEDDDTTKSTRTKLLVKNVAFQTSLQEMRELFSTFGTLKSLSMPKKYDGGHRGFAFVDYVLAHEAFEAKKQLSSSHFYGRHLIIEWAKDDSLTSSNNNIEEIRMKAKKTVNASNVVAGMTKNKKQKQGKEDGFDEFIGNKGGDEDDD
jgi:multiple RNA-binding domain-containing protein 1